MPLPLHEAITMPNNSSPPRLVTVGVIAEEVGATVDRVSRVLRTRPYIRPRAYAGNTRLFDNTAVAQVRHALKAIDARRQGRRA